MGILLAYFVVPAFSLIISIVSAIKYKQILYSLVIAALNSLFCIVSLYILFEIMFQASFWTEIWPIVFSAIILGLGSVTSAIVLIVMKKLKRRKQT